MNLMKTKTALILLSSILPAFAEPRVTTHYSITSETQDFGGGAVASGSYAMTATAGGAGELGNATFETLKGGFAGQLYESVALVLRADMEFVLENGVRSIAATLALDDGTYVFLPASTVAWSVQAGPIADISSDGVIHASGVYADSVATAVGSYGGIPATLDFAIINVTSDDFGAYAADGLPDDWQVFYFGEDSPLAAPGEDADGDGQSNLFEFTAGLVPTDPASRFSLSILPGLGVGEKRIVFSPRLADRDYGLQFRTSLGSGEFQDMDSSIFSDAGETRTVTDPAAGGAQKFYRVVISKPN
jgi:hypothetical protein